MLTRDKLLSPKEVCEKLGIGRSTLWRWSRIEGPAAKTDPTARRMPGFPYAIHLGERCVRFKAIEIDEWVAQHRVAQ